MSESGLRRRTSAFFSLHSLTHRIAAGVHRRTLARRSVVEALASHELLSVSPH